MTANPTERLGEVTAPSGILLVLDTGATESSVVNVGGARLCNFMTTWGDGIFDVFRDLSADGRLLRIRIEMGQPTASSE